MKEVRFKVKPTQTHTWIPGECIIQRVEDAEPVNGTPMVKLHTVLIQKKERGEVAETSWDLIPKAMFESAIVSVDKLKGTWTLDNAVVNQLLGMFSLELD